MVSKSAGDACKDIKVDVEPDWDGISGTAKAVPVVAVPGPWRACRFGPA